MEELTDLLYKNIDAEDSQKKMQGNESEEVSISRQIMMRNLEVHTILIDLLHEGVEVLQEINEKNSENIVLVNLFEKSFKFLTKMIENDNKLNKKFFYDSINFFSECLEFFEVGQTKFICELYKNNYKLSINVDEKLLSCFFKKFGKIHIIQIFYCSLKI